MIHFVYPGVDILEAEFLGCGRYAVSEDVPEGE